VVFHKWLCADACLCWICSGVASCAPVLMGLSLSLAPGQLLSLWAWGVASSVASIFIGGKGLEIEEGEACLFWLGCFAYNLTILPLLVGETQTLIYLLVVFHLGYGIIAKAWLVLLVWGPFSTFLPSVLSNLSLSDEAFLNIFFPHFLGQNLTTDPVWCRPQLYSNHLKWSSNYSGN